MKRKNKPCLFEIYITSIIKPDLLIWKDSSEGFFLPLVALILQNSSFNLLWRPDFPILNFGGIGVMNLALDSHSSQSTPFDIMYYSICSAQFCPGKCP